VSSTQVTPHEESKGRSKLSKEESLILKLMQEQEEALLRMYKLATGI
jgi:hypothetical protein